jgi:hypothetical protein
MIEDVRLALYGHPAPIDLDWRAGGGVPTVHEVAEHIKQIMAK